MIGFRVKKVRQLLRGYRRLKQAGALGRPMEVQIALAETSLGIPKEKISRHLFGAASAKANEAIRDFLIARLGNISLNQSLLTSLGHPNGTVIHPLPPVWREVLRSLGWKVAEARCALLWQGFLFLCWGYGVAQFARSLGLGLAYRFCRQKKIESPYVYFAGLTRNELPQKSLEKSYDIISWYLQWPGRQKGLKTICHNVKNIPEFTDQGVKIRHFDPLAPVGGWLTNGKLLGWGTRNAGLCIIDWLRGRWWSPLMFGPCVQSFIARHQPTCAVDFLFPNSGPRKPLWVYEVEAKGGTTTFYFYSTNCDSFMTEEGYQPTPAYYRNMQWCRYLVWDREQRDFLHRSGNSEKKVLIVGPIWFSDSDEEKPFFPKRSITIFDVPIWRKSIYCSFGLSFEYYLPCNLRAFIEDIISQAKRLGIPVLYKGKREMQKKFIKNQDPGVVKYLNTLIKKSEMISIPSNLSGFRAVEESKIIVSMPFTSPDVIAKKLGKKSFYYDPTGKIQKKDRVARNTIVISSRKNLNKILKYYLKKCQNYKKS